MLTSQATTVLSAGVQSPTSGAGVGHADMNCGSGRAYGTMVGGGGRPATGAMTSPLASTLGPSGGVAEGLVHSGGLGVTLPCASAKHSRLFPEVSDDCSSVETGFAQNVLEKGGTVGSESLDKCFTPICPQTWHHLHFVLSTL